jgi:hypothetical protein
MSLSVETDELHLVKNARPNNADMVARCFLKACMHHAALGQVLFLNIYKRL